MSIEEKDKNVLEHFVSLINLNKPIHYIVFLKVIQILAQQALKDTK